MKIIIGSDHAGYPLKELVRDYLMKAGHEVADVGCHYENGEVTDPAQKNYPLVAEQVAVPVAAGDFERGILICGTGLGIGISANKIPGIRCATCTNHYEVRYTRLHNDANILAMGARVIAPDVAYELVDIFLSTEFEGGRHQTRVDMIKGLEEKYHR